MSSEQLSLHVEASIGLPVLPVAEPSGPNPKGPEGEWVVLDLVRAETESLSDSAKTSRKLADIFPDGSARSQKVETKSVIGGMVEVLLRSLPITGTITYRHSEDGPAAHFKVLPTDQSTCVIKRVGGGMYDPRRESVEQLRESVLAALNDKVMTQEWPLVIRKARYWPSALKRQWFSHDPLTKKGAIEWTETLEKLTKDFDELHVQPGPSIPDSSTSLQPWGHKVTHIGFQDRLWVQRGIQTRWLWISS